MEGPFSVFGRFSADLYVRSMMENESSSRCHRVSQLLVRMQKQYSVMRNGCKKSKYNLAMWSLAYVCWAQQDGFVGERLIVAGWRDPVQVPRSLMVIPLSLQETCATCLAAHLRRTVRMFWSGHQLMTKGDLEKRSLP